MPQRNVASLGNFGVLFIAEAHNALSVESTMLLKLRHLFGRQDGQDLVEYALVVALIAFGAVAAMKGLGSEINTAFMAISSDLASAL
jgi:pilus assembly protein Flp/PilA